MKQFSGVFLSALLCTTTAIQAQNALNASKGFDKILPKATAKAADKKAFATLLRAQAEQAPSIWKITKETEWGWEFGEWTKYFDYSYTYDNKGNVIESLSDDGQGEQNRVTYTYNADGMKTSELSEQRFEGEEWTNSSKQVLEYDPIVKNVWTKRESSQWANGQWQLDGTSNTRTITRDEKGNVTKVEIATWYGKEYDPIIRKYFTYDATTGQCIAFKQDELKVSADDVSGFTWVNTINLKDMVWQKTNGQLTNEPIDWYEGDNLLKSATSFIYDKDGKEVVDMTYSVEYEDNGGYALTIETPNGENTVNQVKTIKDDNGSYELETKQYVGTDKQLTQASKVVETFDNNKNIILSELYDNDGEGGALELSEGSKTSYKYNEENGVIMETLNQVTNEETGEYENMTKMETLSFADVANTNGIGKVDVNASKTTAIYNAQGVYVGSNWNTLPKGLYLVKEGGLTTKKVKE